MKTFVSRLVPSAALLVLTFVGCSTPQGQGTGRLHQPVPVDASSDVTASPTTPAIDQTTEDGVPLDLLAMAEQQPPVEAVPVNVPRLRTTPTAPTEAPESTSDADVGRVRPGLNLRVTVMVGGQVEFDVPSRQVSSQGMVDIPLVGKVPVSGLNLQQVEALLAERFQQYLVSPQVVVEFADGEGSGASPWGYVTVLGRVRQPGKLPVPATHDLTVSAAIQQVGGFDTSARTSSIRITRQQNDGKPQKIKVDLKAYARGDLDEDIVLQAGDVVFVPESAW